MPSPTRITPNAQSRRMIHRILEAELLEREDGFVEYISELTDARVAAEVMAAHPSAVMTAKTVRGLRDRAWGLLHKETVKTSAQIIASQDVVIAKLLERVEALENTGTAPTLGDNVKEIVDSAANTVEDLFSTTNKNG